MNGTTIRTCFLFIGQSPRPDIMDEMRSDLSGRIEPVEYGALDGVGPDGIAALRPRSEEDTLITKLRDGTNVSVSEMGIQNLIREKMDEAFNDGCRLCVILCTGTFNHQKSRIPLITSDGVFHKMLSFPEDVDTLGVIVPVREQIATFSRFYSVYNKKIIMGCASPYGNTEALKKEALRLKELGAGCLCLDCMGYTVKQGMQLQTLTNLTVKVPRREIAEKINALVLMQ